ncbi:GNAT family N-acetyltransferase [Algoriphagus zhangzhouensis]|uniref:Ribosomal protein S18 acetylase RimI n=1 Tax=Algoriphagus zhangzhouensis TaxID=1073327 RepID=A0A1M7ZD07_9BACT|nr:GNAT family N-acetyltransferase [Algoriphagus zhangzhouensis]TDY45691.1 transcriptional regulator [Algoriphagus zhangzhouensis]SHO62754.1 Ribosomal protein S18 acetylase RimI [Algoriphagus zhangzhouensis]
MEIRKATLDDLPAIVEMLTDDEIGQTREDFKIPLPSSYVQAFEKIIADPNQELIVIENEEGVVIGTMQLTFIQYLMYQGGIRAQIEAVQIKKEHRSQGIGSKMMNWAIARAKERKAQLIQLTSNKKRSKAIRFYEGFGFEASHEGMKLYLSYL